MSTRGAIGFVKGDEFKVTYNHSDSYPSYLGVEMVNYIKSKSIDDLNKDFDSIKMIDENTKPTMEEKQKLNKWLNLSVSNQSDDDWYCLLRNAQGDLNASAQAGYMIDSKEFLYDSLFCEWAYLINLNKNLLEVYKGFQGSKPKGRFSDIPPNDSGYYAVSLIAEIPFSKLSEEKILKLK